ncbi:MAG: hypothetical protein IJL02_10145 [Methanobrevibacter sp.]|uniref:glycosyltransferase family 39 protein n=1 Tax=Methanobrevibacter sp. TaxID=66852 RepID=UPI0025F18A3F|nr:hypothetical protein [Methanobrevibacter sp.]MBQ6100203.1 hypothetical protein [Methanobrevibacter sp.]
MSDKNLIGKILFLLSIILLGVMIAVIFKKPFLETDEWFTKGIIQLSFQQMVNITAIDVHPPLYYIILKIPMKILAMLHIGYDLVTLMKVMSILPLFILLGISATTLRKNFGWLSAGFFALTIITMSSFFRVFLTARMYNWGILFLVLSFLCVYYILKESNYKYWILLAIFSVLGAYTHYFVAISSVALYMILFVNILFNKSLGFERSDLKKWFVSTVVGVILYVPWLFTLFSQLNKVHKSYWIPSVDLAKMVESFSIVFTNNSNFMLGVILAVVVIALTAFVVLRYLKSKSKDDFFLLLGFAVFIVTIVLAFIVSVTFKPILLARYLVPAIALIWLSISILVSDIDFKKFVIPIVIVVLVFGAFNLVDQISVIDDDYAKTVEANAFLDNMSNNDTIVIISGMQKYVRFFNEIDDAKQYYVYTFDNKTHKEPYLKILKLNKTSFDIPQDVYSNPDKQIYIIVDKKSEFENNTDVDFDKVFNLRGCIFYKINGTNTTNLGM